jgi:dihydroxyacetone kinase
MSILTNACVKYLESKIFGCKVTRLLVGSYMTSFDMHGVSVTILNTSNSSNKLVDLLDSPCDAPAWRACDVWKAEENHVRGSSTQRSEVMVAEETVVATANLPPMTFSKEFSKLAKASILRAVKCLSEEEATLTKYDTIVGDGDCVSFIYLILFYRATYDIFWIYQLIKWFVINEFPPHPPTYYDTMPINRALP